VHFFGYHQDNSDENKQPKPMFGYIVPHSLERFARGEGSRCEEREVSGVSQTQERRRERETRGVACHFFFSFGRTLSYDTYGAWSVVIPPLLGAPTQHG
jgi:hypothetical protein